MSLNVQLLRDSFTAFTPNADVLSHSFYRILFERYPALEPLFINVDIEDQQKKLFRSLSVIVRNLEDPGYLRSYLCGLGMMHVAYGARESHYEAVGECLLAALAQVAGPLWNDELHSAWADAYDVIAGLMKAGAAEGVAN